MKTIAIIAAGVALAGPAAAQSLRPSLDYASAATIRDTCIAWAGERDLKITLFVMDAHGRPITSAHMDGVSTAAGEIARWKAESSSKSGRATAALAAMKPPANMPTVAAIGGGVPIYTTDGILLGGVGASGAKSEEDAACGTAGVEAAGLSASRPE